MTPGEDSGAPSDAPDVGAGGLPIGGLHAALSLVCGGLAFVVGLFWALYPMDEDDVVAVVVALVVASLWFGAFALALPQHAVSRIVAGIGMLAALTALCGLCGVIL